MDATALAEFVSRAVAEGWAALGIMCIVAYDARQELKISRSAEDRCEQNLRRCRVAVARLYWIIKAKSGESDPLPPLDDLMSERRHGAEL